MPTFMDRHDLLGFKPEQVATAHLQDLWKQSAYGSSFLTYWFDEARGSVFCLAEAPDKDSVVSVHREAHGGVPCAIFEVDPHAVTSFLGAIAGSVRELALGKGFAFVDRGEASFKGFDEPVRLFEVSWTG